MWVVVTVIAVVCLIVIVAVRLALVGRRQVHEPQPVAVDPADASEFPEPGEPSPRLDDGSPVPGSRAHRAAHHGHHAGPQRDLGQHPHDDADDDADRDSDRDSRRGEHRNDPPAQR